MQEKICEKKNNVRTLELAKDKRQWRKEREKDWSHTPQVLRKNFVELIPSKIQFHDL